MAGAQKESAHAQNPRGPSPRFDIHLGQRQIARGTPLAQSSVHDYLTRFAASGAASVHKRPPDFARIYTELRASKHTTLQLLWEEYRQDAEAQRFRGGILGQCPPLSALPPPAPRPRQPDKPK